MDSVMSDAGFRLDWHAEASFGPPEQPIFEAAGKGPLFHEVVRIPAVFVASWTRCDP